MKKINFFDTSKKALVALVCSVSFVALFSACSDDGCYNKGYPLKCANTDYCCPYDSPYYGTGSGKCHNSL